ncbi:MAG: hypothetical protein V1808_00870 [Candidatus Daviesbacteria bacterium]
MLNRFKKSIAIISIIGLLFLRVAPILAYEIPSAPTPPSAPTTLVEPTPPPAPETPILEDSAPTPPPAPTLEETISSQDLPSDEADEENNEESSDESSNTSSNSSTSDPFGTTENSSTLIDSGTTYEQTGGESADGQTGSATVNTGNATNTAGVSTVTNSNISAGVVGPDSDSVGVINLGNGSDSTNNGSVEIIDNNNTFQDNSAIVTSNLNQTTKTGDNSASKNVGDSKISTGDANTSGTVITAVNTNIDGMAVAEFSVVDDQVGDIILDFSADCIYGCKGGSLTAQNIDNGSSSNNNTAIDTTTNNITIQTNDALIESNLNLSSDSGGNKADKNTGGSSEIITGDANVAGNALTLANNNLAGGVYFNFVYIYGDLIGDIIMPEDYFTTAPYINGGGDFLAANTDNGSDSTNTALIDQTTNNNTFQYNEANIENNMLLDATTGNNETSKNTGGNSEITTGDTDINAQVLNVANSNVSEEDWWLVLINDAGNWVGQILGAPSGSRTFAGSDGTQFSVDENGIITAVNSGNGTASTNNSGISNTTNNTTVQNNTANIVNNMDLSANTGGNSASKNTGGDSKVTTGDANIIASIINMVNNNVSGGGRLFVTVVDVFGSWLGNFRTPGYKPEVTLAQDQNNSDSQPNPKGGPQEGSIANNTNNNSFGLTQDPTNSSNNQGAEITQNNTIALSNPNSGGSNSQSANFVQVAGSQIENEPGTTENQLSQASINGKKNIKINLAWLLLGLPVLPLGLTAFIKYNALIRKRNGILHI